MYGNAFRYTYLITSTPSTSGFYTFPLSGNNLLLWALLFLSPLAANS